MRTSKLTVLALAIPLLLCTAYQSNARKPTPELEKRIKTTISKSNLKLFSSRFSVAPQPVDVLGFGRSKNCTYRVSYRTEGGSGDNRDGSISLVEHKKKNHLTVKMENALSSAYIERLGYMTNFTIRDNNGEIYSSKTIDRDTARYKDKLLKRGVLHPRLVFDISMIVLDFERLSWKPGENVASVFDTDHNEYGTYRYLGSGLFQGQSIAVLDFTVSKEFPASNQGKVVARLALDYETMLPVLFVVETKGYLLKLEQNACI